MQTAPGADGHPQYLELPINTALPGLHRLDLIKDGSNLVTLPSVPPSLAKEEWLGTDHRLAPKLHWGSVPCKRIPLVTMLNR